MKATLPFLLKTIAKSQNAMKMRHENSKHKQVKNLRLFDTPIHTVTYLFASLLSFQIYSKLFYFVFFFRMSSKERSGGCLFSGMPVLRWGYPSWYSATHVLRKTIFSVEPCNFLRRGYIILSGCTYYIMCYEEHKKAWYLDLFICNEVENKSRINLE